MQKKRQKLISSDQPKQQNTQKKQAQIDWNQLHAIQKQFTQFMKVDRKGKSHQIVYRPMIQQLAVDQIIQRGTINKKMMVRVSQKYIFPSYISTINFRNNPNEECKQQKDIQKYWNKRYMLFQKFDQGIKLDHQSWFSVTPQSVAEYIAGKLANGKQLIIDGFCGAGGDSIQFGKFCNKVISNDIDIQKINMIKNNSLIYGVKNIDFVCGDFFYLNIGKRKANLVYMSPPWGGPNYSKYQNIYAKKMSPPLDQIIKKSLTLSDNVCLLLPINMDIDLLIQAIYQAYEESSIQNKCPVVGIQKIYFCKHLKFLLIIVGPIVYEFYNDIVLEYPQQQIVYQKNQIQSKENQLADSSSEEKTKNKKKKKKIKKSREAKQNKEQNILQNSYLNSNQNLKNSNIEKMQEKLSKWIRTSLNDGFLINHKHIKDKAKQIMNDLGDNNSFKANKKWIKMYLQNNTEIEASICYTRQGKKIIFNQEDD